MLNQHECSGVGEYCDCCREHRDDPVHLKAERSGFWGALTFFALTLANTAAVVSYIYVNRWDRATFFLVMTLELLRLWGKYESKRQ